MQHFETENNDKIKSMVLIWSFTVCIFIMGLHICVHEPSIMCCNIFTLYVLFLFNTCSWWSLLF